ncbi:MAG: hypothetical protein V9E89_14845 [Ilumatobacteraceae bacterium]
MSWLARWPIAISRPTRPKNASLATSAAGLQLQLVEQLDQPAEPHLAPRQHTVRVGDTDVLPHPEGLQPHRIHRRLMAKAVRLVLDDHPIVGEVVGQRRIERVAACWGQGHVGLGEQVLVPFAGVQTPDQLAVRSVIATERVDRTGQLREVPQVLDLVEDGPRQHRGEAGEPRRVRPGQTRARGLHALQDGFVLLALAIQAVDTGWDQMPSGEEPFAQF